jgi:hypothetical protein
MKLPSKSTPYKDSVIALFPSILSLLKQGDRSVLELYKKAQIEDVGDYANALDCLYALGKIEITQEGGMLHYVG